MKDRTWRKIEYLTQMEKPSEDLEIKVWNFCEDCDKTTVHLADLMLLNPSTYRIDCQDCKASYSLPYTVPTYK